MIQYFITIFIVMLVNIPAIIPSLLLKSDKSIKLQVAIRVYLTTVLLILSLITLASNFVSNHTSYPALLPLIPVVLFAIALHNCGGYLRKVITRKKRRAIILSSFAIVYIIRFNVVIFDNGMGYQMTSYGMVWTAFFVFGCLLAYIATSDDMRSSTYTASNTTNSESRVDKTHATQSEIDADLSVKGRSILFDPNISISEQQRYKAALDKKEDESGSGY